MNILSISNNSKVTFKKSPVAQDLQKYSNVTDTPVSSLTKVADVHNKSEAQKISTGTSYSIRMPASFSSSSKQAKEKSYQQICCMEQLF